MGYSRKKSKQGAKGLRHGISRGKDEENVEIPGVNKKRSLEFSGIIKRKLCGIFMCLGFWSLDFQGV